VLLCNPRPSAAQFANHVFISPRDVLDAGDTAHAFSCQRGENERGPSAQVWDLDL
jgi:hypothetical protein